jgi:ComF family protein
MQQAWRDNRSLGPVDLIVPVPLAPTRLAQRGFNQSALLADYLSRETGLPLAEDVLTRCVETGQQSRTPGRDRFRNMRGAFVVPRQARCTGARVLLVDDVLTTGATADSCALALLDAGAAAVSVLAVANGHTGQDWLDPL